VTRQKLNENDISTLIVVDDYVGRLSLTRETGLPFANSVWRGMWEDYAVTLTNYFAAYKPTKKPKKGKGK
jgi:hypothetical protein